MADIISIGMLVTDTLVRPVSPDIFTKDSAHVQIHSMPGGDACNVCLDAAAMGLSASLVSSVGNDANGSWLLSYLKNHGVETTGIHISDNYGTAQSLVLTEPSGERHFLTSTDIFEDISPDFITDDRLREAKFLSLNSYYRMKKVDGEPAVSLFHRAHSLGVRTVLDTMTCRSRDPLQQIAPVLAETDFFLPNYEEAKQITGKTKPADMADVLKSTGLCTLVVKLGADGAEIFDFIHEEHYYIPAFVVDNPVSTVGAGDAWCAGLIAGLIHGYSLFDSTRIACAAASLTVQCEGATGGIHSFEEVLKIVR